MSKAYSFFLDGKPLCAKKCQPTETLNNIRNISLKNKIDDTIIFLNGDIPIDKSDEKDFNLDEINISGKINLKHDESNLKSFQIYLNGVYLTDFNANENENLDSLRKKLEIKIKEDFQFLMKNDSIVEKEDEKGEDSFTILDIEKEGIIYLKQEKGQKEFIMENNDKNGNNDKDGNNNNKNRQINENKIN